MNISGGQAMHGKTLDDAHGQRLILLPVLRKATFHLVDQHVAAINGVFNVWIGAHGGGLKEESPEVNRRDQAWHGLGDVLLAELLEVGREHLEHASLLDDWDTLEGLHIVGMHRKKLNELVEPLRP